MRFAFGIAGVCLWMAIIILGASWVGPYWNILFNDSFGAVPAGIAVGLGLYALGAWCIMDWGNG